MIYPLIAGAVGLATVVGMPVLVALSIILRFM